MPGTEITLNTCKLLLFYCHCFVFINSFWGCNHFHLLNTNDKPLFGKYFQAHDLFPY